MPVIRVPITFPDLEHAVEDIEQTAKIVGVTSDGAGSLFIVTEPKVARRAPGSKETR